ncbi:acyl-CoA thioesterase [Tepidibacillus fermentans]|uniref:Acyl-CoA thioester hydrolase n=1 Tax=Tepidibacillus fermentans TaxID=1281767 RepID=A0A4R3KLB5_9BACI|nr:thioesterase family protein [Tepidibacillus fermentans]TCS83580.1 acyl-CoA thioester hydrolase [Tepidibacillus fermentans]
MKWYDTEIRVRYQETDQMGVVYHANYLVWFEVARTELVRALGVDYRKLEKMGLYLPVVDVSCQYKLSAKYDDEIIVRSRIAEYSSLRLTMEYEVIRKEDGKLLATGKTKHVWLDQEYRPVRLDRFASEIDQVLRTQMNTEN